MQTFVTYLRNATQILRSLGAQVIIASQTPTNLYTYYESDYNDNDESSGGHYSYSWVPTIYEWYSWYVVDSLLGPEKHDDGGGGIYYVNHGDYGAQELRRLGGAATDANFPMDNTHTAPWLADVFARAFVLGVKCGTAPLQDFVVNATSRIEGDLLGYCERVNSTLPIRR